MRVARKAVPRENAESFIRTRDLGPFTSAIESGDLETVRHLIRFGRNVNYKDEKGMTPIKVALLMEKHEIFTFLLDNGADVRGNGEGSLLYAALNCENEYCTGILLFHPQIDPNERFLDGKTPLITATERGLWSVVELLLVCGADPNLTDSSGKRAVDYAPKELKSLLSEN